MNIEAQLDSYQTTCLLLAAVESGLLDAIPDGGIPLAKLSASFDARALPPVIDALVELGVVVFRGDEVSLTPNGYNLTHSILRAKATLIAESYLPAWRELASALLGKGNPSMLAFGQSHWAQRMQHPEQFQAFNHFLGRSTKSVSTAFVNAYAFHQHTVACIGGGDGELLFRILKKAPHAHGYNVEQFPDELASAQAQDFTARALAHGVADRATLINGSFFDSRLLPIAEVYVAQFVFHDWDDDHCLALLRTLKTNAPPGAKLVVVESSSRAALKNLHLFVLNGGKERTSDEFQELFNRAGMGQVRRGNAGGAVFLEVTITPRQLAVLDDDSNSPTIPAPPVEGRTS